MPPPRMCASESDCGTQASCVAGRCVARGATPAIATARRLLVGPVEAAWVRRGGGAPSDVATLGRGDGGTGFLRFSVSLAPEVTVLEAYVVLERVADVDSDPASIGLHAARVVGPWDARSLSWGTQPPVEEVGSPVTWVSPTAGPTVRLDVREIVKRWRRRERGDFGVAVVAEGESSTGIALALTPRDEATDRGDPELSSPTIAASQLEPRPVPLATVGDPRHQQRGPALELYVK
jgi:hypothetical protein